MQKTVITIDDDSYYLDEIKEICQESHLKALCFEGPNEFEEKCSKEAIKSASLILVDFDFYTSTALENDIAGYIRDSGYKGKMYLWTLHEEFDEDDRKKIASDFDGVINKREISGPKIQSLIS